MKKGDIILLPFPFTDLSGSKLRPAVILIVLKDDVTVGVISSNINSIESNEILLNPDRSNGLKKTSILKLAKIATIRKTLVIGQLGHINNQDAIDMDLKLKVLLNLK